MIASRGGRRVAAFVAGLVLVACAPMAVVERPAARGGGRTMPSLDAFEQQHRDQAVALAREQRWSEAGAQWQVLALLRPDVPEYRRQADEIDARIKEATAERLEAAAEARRRGDTEQASLLYLKALSLDPGNLAAMQGLRQIEKEHATRGNHFRSGRAPTMPKPAAEASPPKPAAAPYPVERRDLDYGVMLFHQADYGSSIKALERFLKGSPQDELGRRYLAGACIQLGQQRLQQGRKEEALALFEKAEASDAREAANFHGNILALRRSLAEDYYQQGLRIYNADIRRAIEYWERSLKYDPQHLQSSMRLRQARQMEKNLKAIEGGRGQK